MARVYRIEARSIRYFGGSAHDLPQDVIDALIRHDPPGEIYRIDRGPHGALIKWVGGQVFVPSEVADAFEAAAAARMEAAS